MKVVLCTFLVFTLKFASSSKLPSLINEQSTYDDLIPEDLDIHELQQAVIGSKRCMPDLGCFVVTKDFFHTFYRPVNFLPFDRETIDTRFFLYTKSSPKECHSIDVSEPDEIKSSPLNPSHRTVFIVHGFFDSRFYGKWMEIVKDDMLLNNDYNVIIVDWSKGNGGPYTQATANTRVVGAEIALMIETLQKLKDVSPMDCHIIGHSLGAHIAGYAGERLNKLGRITGLDPAQPYFQYMPPSVRLDKTDADFVDVIHTDSASIKFLALGMSQAIGHVDFYPNNGMSQPGCTYAMFHSIFLEGLVDAARRFVACNHQRAVDFFTYSINYKRALPVAYHCKRWEDYLEGQCAECGPNNTKCAVLGLQAEQYKLHKNDSQSIKMYLSTAKSAPFWEYSYQIKLKLKKPKTYFKDGTGEINLKIQGPKSVQDVSLSTKSRNLIHGATYNFLVRRKEAFGEIKNISFSWKSSSWNFLRSHTLYLEFVKITPMNIDDEKTQKQKTKLFCNISEEGVKSGHALSLTKC